jgi:hypothetical protein
MMMMIMMMMKMRRRRRRREDDKRVSLYIYAFSLYVILKNALCFYDKFLVEPNQTDPGWI